MITNNIRVKIAIVTKTTTQLSPCVKNSAILIIISIILIYIYICIQIVNLTRTIVQFPVIIKLIVVFF